MRSVLHSVMTRLETWKRSHQGFSCMSNASKKQSNDTSTMEGDLHCFKCEKEADNYSLREIPPPFLGMTSAFFCNECTRQLKEHGFLEDHPDPTTRLHPPRYKYKWTEKGAEKLRKEVSDETQSLAQASDQATPDALEDEMHDLAEASAHDLADFLEEKVAEDE